jgi:ankyrin repeat protein
LNTFAVVRGKNSGYRTHECRVYQGMPSSSSNDSTSSVISNRIAIPNGQHPLLTQLITAICDEDTGTVRALIAEGVPINSRTALGQSPLGSAASQGNADLVTLLLKYGANPNGLGINDHTMLTLAAQSSCVRTVQVLLEHGADANASRRRTGETPLIVAAARAQTDIVATLIAAGARVNARTKAEIETDLLHGHAEVCEETALHHAAESAPMRLIHLLLAAGADRKARTISGETPCSWARKARRPLEIIRLLDPRDQPGV